MERVQKNYVKRNLVKEFLIRYHKSKHRENRYRTEVLNSQSDDYVIPDIMVTCDKKNLKGGSYFGIPKFVAETLSPATALRDRTIKKDIYESCGVEEYWIVSPKEKAVEIYELNEGKYRLVHNYILDEEPDSEYYNAKTEITLKAFPITMTLEEIFEGVD